MGLRPPPGGPIAHTKVISTSFRNEPITKQHLIIDIAVEIAKHCTHNILFIAATNKVCSSPTTVSYIHTEGGEPGISHP